MNVILSGNQSDTQRGEINLPAAVNLTGLEGYLVKISNNNGLPNFALPTATDDFAVYVLLSGDVQGNIVAAESPDLDDNCRVMLNGTCNPGDQLCLADPATPANAGMLRTIPVASGTYRTLFIAEEAGANGQFVKCRRVGERTTTH
jgi:hypothetical protein